MALDWAQSVADEKARKIQSGGAALIDNNAAWRKGFASEKQKAMLDKFRIKYLPGITKGEAADKLDAVFLKIAQRKAEKAKVQA
jgi:hypothetical protein